MPASMPYRSDRPMTHAARNIPKFSLATPAAVVSTKKGTGVSAAINTYETPRLSNSPTMCSIASAPKTHCVPLAIKDAMTK